VLAERVAAFYATAKPEKVYLHLDRPVYGTGETIWFNAYLVDALRHRPDSLSKILYVELLSPQPAGSAPHPAGGAGRPCQR
jgi:hypothetical protein